MAIVVKSNKALDQALGLLQREVSRERILQTNHEQRYYIPKTIERHEIKRANAKTKKWKRKIRRIMKNRGHI